MGLPVVSTLHSGIPEGVLDGRSGFLVPERDVEAVAGRLRCLIDHPERWGDMGRAGRSLMEEHADIEKLNDRLVQVYKRLLGQRTGPEDRQGLRGAVT
jgi:colanic acid/amylovoran biosynthesis glycosyltransferase